MRSAIFFIGLIEWVSVMPSRSDIYRTKALELRRLASTTNNSVLNHQFMDLARQWREMADEEEKNPVRLDFDNETRN